MPCYFIQNCCTVIFSALLLGLVRQKPCSYIYHVTEKAAKYFSSLGTKIANHHQDNYIKTFKSWELQKKKVNIKT